VLGSLTFDAGATFDLTIPTPIQLGQLFVEGVFEERGQDPVHLGSDIAIWSLPAATS
jgi:hypothetical protein